MALFCISDLHLSFAVDKPMDVFGPRWADYTKKIEKNWLDAVGPGDTVVLPGDLSWGMDLAQALPDFRFVDRLPGIKYISKGNHDYFWDTASKITNFFDQNEISSIKLLHNNFYPYGDIAICGTKGWFYEEDFGDAHDEKIFKRESIRLRASLDAARKSGHERFFVFLHYPPICQGREAPDIIELLREYQVESCYFGHLHGYSHASAFQGERYGIRFGLVSSDYLDFKPLLICK